MRIVPADARGIAMAAEALRNGEVVAYPTETVYGLGVDPLSEPALERLFAVKQRDKNAPVLLILGTVAQLDALTEDINDVARVLAKAFWPGPLSMLFRPRVNVSRYLAGPDGRICVRWTASAVARELCVSFGGAIVSTSANATGEAPATAAAEVELDGIALILDGGVLPPSAPSTIYDPDSRAVLRQGAVNKAAIEAALSAAQV